MTPRATKLVTLSVTVPEEALEAYEAVLAEVCDTIGLFLEDEEARIWRVEGVKNAGINEENLSEALALAEAATGIAADLHREETPAEGWLARTYSSFPEQRVGKRFAIRGTHLPNLKSPGRITLRLDASVAFGSGEHPSTRGCLLALEHLAPRKFQNILDLGTGSGILALAASSLLHRKVLATDIDPWSVRMAHGNAALNHLSPRIRVIQSNGWRHPILTRHAPYDLVFANILARPLTKMAHDLSLHLAPNGVAILSGLLSSQECMVLAAHRRHGLKLSFRMREANWSCLVIAHSTA